MSEARAPVLTSLHTLQHKRKREKKLGRTKMQRDRIVQNLSKQGNDADEIRRLQKSLMDVNKRISSMQGVVVKRPSAAQVILFMCGLSFCFFTNAFCF